MLEDVIKALQAVPRDRLRRRRQPRREVCDLARALGAKPIEEPADSSRPEPGAHARPQRYVGHAPDALLVVLADVPGREAGRHQRGARRAAPDRGVVGAPSSDGAPARSPCARPTSSRSASAQQSFQNHKREAAAREIEHAIVRNDALANDIDEPADLQAPARTPRGDGDTPAAGPPRRRGAAGLGRAWQARLPGHLLPPLHPPVRAGARRPGAGRRDHRPGLPGARAASLAALALRERRLRRRPRGARRRHVATPGARTSRPRAAPSTRSTDLLKSSRSQVTEPPVVLLACIALDEARPWPDDRRRAAERDMFVQSLGAALQNILLAAEERGLAGYLKGAPLFCGDAIREALRAAGRLAAGVPRAARAAGPGVLAVTAGGDRGRAVRGRAIASKELPLPLNILIACVMGAIHWSDS